MSSTKKSLLVFGQFFNRVILVVLALICLLVVAAIGTRFYTGIEAAEIGRALPEFTQNYFSFRETMQQNTGNEFTGELTAFLFGSSCIPVVIDLLLRAAIHYLPFTGRAASVLRNVKKIQRKYLMPLHTYLSILALSLGVLHLALSVCVDNPFPELGLILSGILVASGLLFKWKALPTLLRKALYKFHVSLLVSGTLLVILLFGHALMDSD